MLQCIQSHWGVLSAGEPSAEDTSEEDDPAEADEAPEDGEVWQDNFRLEYVVQPPAASRSDIRGKYHARASKNVIALEPARDWLIAAGCVAAAVVWPTVLLGLITTVAKPAGPHVMEVVVKEVQLQWPYLLQTGFLWDVLTVYCTCVFVPWARTYAEVQSSCSGIKVIRLPFLHTFKPVAACGEALRREGV